MKRLALAFLIFTSAFSLEVRAARPLITDDFYIVPLSHSELEFGYASTQNPTFLDNAFTISLKHGVWPNLDLGLEIPYTASSPSGWDDIYLHAKYCLWRSSDDEGLTARADYKFKNAKIGQGLGSGDNDFWLMLIYSNKFGQLKAHLNFGYVNVGVNAGQIFDDYLAYAGAIEYSVWGDQGEVVAEYVMNNVAQPNPAFIQLGARYVVSRGLKFDVGYGFGLNSNSLKNSLAGGLHYEF
jgi:hypothetical protein